MVIDDKIYLIFIFSLLFWFSITIFSHASILPSSELQTLQLMMSNN